MENRRNIHLFKLRIKKIEREKMKEEADRSISQEYKFFLDIGRYEHKRQEIKYGAIQHMLGLLH